MFDLFKAIILGLVQGLTEFIPVSSSGHLVIVPWVLGWAPPGLLFDTILHWGTLVAIFAAFWGDFVGIIKGVFGSLRSRSLADPNARLGWFIVAGSVPAAVTGLLFKDIFESLFHSPATTGALLLVTALLLVLSEQIGGKRHLSKTTDTLKWRDAIAIGLAQAVALAPGISRSGSTIAAGLMVGLSREAAARYSFLLGTPAFFGAGLLQLVDTLATDVGVFEMQLPMLLVGFTVSAISGYLTIRFLLSYLRRHTLYIFAGYCTIVGLAVLIMARF